MEQHDMTLLKLVELAGRNGSPLNGSPEWIGAANSDDWKYLLSYVDILRDNYSHDPLMADDVQRRTEVIFEKLGLSLRKRALAFDPIAALVELRP